MNPCVTCGREIDNEYGTGHCTACCSHYGELHGGPKPPALVLAITGPDEVHVCRVGGEEDFSDLLLAALTAPTVAGMLTHFAADAVAVGAAGMAERASALATLAVPADVHRCIVCGRLHGDDHWLCDECSRRRAALNKAADAAAEGDSL